MMKQYFTGFFTAACLTTSLFLFTGAQKANTQSEPIIIKSEEGTTTIGGGFIEVVGTEIAAERAGADVHGSYTFAVVHLHKPVALIFCTDDSG